MSVEQMIGYFEERARVEALYWAGVLIWAGAVVGANSFGYLPQIGDAGVWSWLFLGAGIYGTLMNLFYAASSYTINPTTWDYIWSGFWLVVGLSSFLAIDVFWPVVLISIGTAVLVNAYRRG